MTAHLRRSRIAKVLTDKPGAETEFPAVEARLAAVKVAIVVPPDQVKTAAGQAAALTAIVTACKCFGSAALVANPEQRLVRPLPFGDTLGSAALALGAAILPETPISATHVIVIGELRPLGAKIFARCWWDGWKAGVVPAWDERVCGKSGNPIAGVFAGALAVRAVFAEAVEGERATSRASVASLWQPWEDPSTAPAGPDVAHLPSSLWFVGLGHVGQGFLWSLGFLPVAGALAVLQDDQTAGEENVATGLLTADIDVEEMKTRVATRWLEPLGWKTLHLERRHYGDFKLRDDDPAIVLTSIDEPAARMKIAGAGFAYMIDAGVGHGPDDFDRAQIRVLPKGSDPERFWSAPAPEKDVDALLRQKAYQAYAKAFDKCGAFPLAEASAAVPFVGAVVGAVTIAQLLRLGSMQCTMQLMTIDLECPSMVTPSGLNERPLVSLGSLECQFAAGTIAASTAA